jgi:hypothetical protein
MWLEHNQKVIVSIRITGDPHARPTNSWFLNLWGLREVAIFQTCDPGIVPNGFRIGYIDSTTSKAYLLDRIVRERMFKTLIYREDRSFFALDKEGNPVLLNFIARFPRRAYTHRKIRLY